MKKNVSSAVVELINKMQEQIAAIDRKIDMLISKPSIRPVEVKPFQQPAHAHSQSDRRQDNSFRGRILHKAICADCKKGCEVPFKPSGERPVYCKECFSKRRVGGPFKARPDNRPRAAAPIPAVHINKPESVEKKRPVAKKKPVSKKKKK